MTAICKRCGRVLSRGQAVATGVGILCRKHAEHLPPYLRKPKVRPKQQTS